MISMRPLSKSLGVEVQGIDITTPLDESTLTALQAAYDRHHLLLVRAPDLSAAHHVAFVSRFGPLLVNEGVDHAFVSNSRPDGIIGRGPLLFHSDLAFTTEPDLGLSLYAIEVPPEGTSTHFANALAAYDALPPDLRQRIADLEARHAFDLRTQKSDTRAIEVPVPEQASRAVHPIALQHPRLDRPVLYVNAMQTESIIGLTDRETRALLDELFDHLYSPDNLYEHHWREGDLLVWDNLALQHARGEMSEHPRTLRRATLALSPIEELVPGFVASRRAV